MNTLLKTTALSIAALLTTSTYASAMSLDVTNPDIVHAVQLDDIPAPSGISKTALFTVSTKIGIARLDKGRLIAAPMVEMRDWGFLDKRTAQRFDMISPGAVLNNIPDVPMNGRDSDNKLDEIRMTASDLKMDYVLIYGMGNDAKSGQFAGKGMAYTGFITDTKTTSPRAAAKAVLVNTYTGEIYGTLISNEVEFGVGDLTDKVQALVSTLNTVI